MKASLLAITLLSSVCIVGIQAATDISTHETENALKENISKGNVSDVHTLLSTLLDEDNNQISKDKKIQIIESAASLAKDQLKHALDSQTYNLVLRLGKGVGAILLGTASVYKLVIQPYLNGSLSLDALIQDPKVLATSSLIAFGLREIQLGLSNADSKQAENNARAIKENASKAYYKLQATK